MIEHDRDPASQQADHPVDEDGPPLAAFQHLAGGDLTCRQVRSACNRDALPVWPGGASVFWRPAARPVLRETVFGSDAVGTTDVVDMLERRLLNHCRVAIVNGDCYRMRQARAPGLTFCGRGPSALTGWQGGPCDGPGGAVSVLDGMSL
jgi:hypothetical protein